ncbi:MAG: hypothetical protein V9E93_01145 [Steroidobacteraceae bacterium]
MRDLGDEQVPCGRRFVACGLGRQLGFGEFQLREARVVGPQAIAFEQRSREPFARSLRQLRGPVHREAEPGHDGGESDRPQAVEGQMGDDQRRHLRHDHVEVGTPCQRGIQGRHAGRSGQQHRVGDLRRPP